LIPHGVDINGEAAGDESGHSVSINASGYKVAIRAPKNDGNVLNAGHEINPTAPQKLFIVLAKLRFNVV